eukprot:s3037_g4.t1
MVVINALDQITVEFGADLEAATRLSQMLVNHPQLFMRKKQQAGFDANPRDGVDPALNDGGMDTASGEANAKGESQSEGQNKSEGQSEGRHIGIQFEVPRLLPMHERGRQSDPHGAADDGPAWLVCFQGCSCCQGLHALGEQRVFLCNRPGSMKESWTKAVSDAQGHATTMVCELENFESQEKLCELINQSKEGLSSARKDSPQVTRGSNLAFASSGKCLTMEAIQSAVVESLSIAANPAAAGIRGDATLQYCAGKSDWKYKKDWLCEKKDDSHSQFCRRCNYGQSPAEHWLDVLQSQLQQTGDGF